MGGTRKRRGGLTKRVYLSTGLGWLVLMNTRERQGVWKEQRVESYY